MLDASFFQKSNAIFKDLFDLAVQELGSAGAGIEPSGIVEKIISPLRELYLKNLCELLESRIEKKT